MVTPSKKQVGVAVLVFLLFSCGTDTSSQTFASTTTEPVATPTSTVPPTTTEPPPGINTRYESIFDMRAAAEGGGLSCDPWEVRPSNDYSIESAACGDQLVFAVYENASLIVEHRGLRNDLMSLVRGVAYDLTGPNWNVTCGDHLELCEMPVMGGS